MKVGLPTSKVPSSAWRRAFADALIELRPDLNPDVADELSDSAFMALSDLDTRSTATRYSQFGDLPAPLPARRPGRN